MDEFKDGMGDDQIRIITLDVDSGDETESRRQVETLLIEKKKEGS